MSKICILSFPRYFNYGTFLQMYALQTKIQRLGHHVEFIDYDPYNDSGKRALLGNPKVASLKKFLRKLRPSVDSKSAANFTVAKDRQKQRFQEFLNKQINLGETTYFTADELETTPPAADAVIVGSDQVWNPNGHYKDPAYFLPFVEREKRIAYAPSFGVSKVPADARVWLSAHINSIPHLSVREQAGSNIIRRLTARNVPVVLDPVYLLTADDWDRFSGEHSLIGKKYMLCYFLESDTYMRETALRIARERQLRPVMIPVHSCDNSADRHPFSIIKDAGPKEFVQLIKNADFVCTDSFHGTSFSLLLKRQFVTFKRYENTQQAANHSRIESILRATGMTDCLADKTNATHIAKENVAFDYAEAALNHLREQSEEFLENSINTATGNSQMVAQELIA